MKNSRPIQTTLFHTTMKVDRSADQSHLMFRIFVPEGIRRLEVDFSYSPAEEYNLDELRELVDTHMNFYDFKVSNNKKAMEKILPIRNLLTISIDDPEGFRGSCHRWQPKASILIQEEQSTPGILNGKIQSGMWNVIVNCHAIVTEECNLEITVRGEHTEEQTKRWYNKPFAQLDFPIKASSAVPRQEKRDYTWTKTEIHTHTNHSDASQSIEQLLLKAKELGIEWVAITDHNTMSAVENLEQLEEDYGLRIMRGIEWTTYYGHLLTLGYNDITAINWSKVGPHSLEESVMEIKREGAIAGIAHPFRPGGPFCTGCNWEYETANIDHFDFIEVWNGENPHKDKYNMKAFQLWTQLLNEGHQIAATCGRDWHNSETDKEIAFLYTYLPEASTADECCDAIRSGHSFITLGPIIDFNVNQHYIPGDKCNKSTYQSVEVNVRLKGLSGTENIVIDSNKGQLREDCTSNIHLKIKELNELSWIRVCVYTKKRELIAFTNPIYFEN